MRLVQVFSKAVVNAMWRIEIIEGIKGRYWVTIWVFISTIRYPRSGCGDGDAV